ncbi:MAG: hypothetical protein J3Q66DRAFT_445180 [Benniella sp.]|nr:MAG: hypothetical protein J3Q66DRAFT_445180 [Benniella sp.]
MLFSHLAPGSYQRPGMEYFVNIFKDPPNVDELLTSVRSPPTSVEAYKHLKLTRPTLYTEERLSVSYLRMGDDSTREKAFLAALYLKDRLGMDDKELQSWCKNPHFHRLGQIAREIGFSEPRFRGISPTFLLEHHQCVIMQWRNLDEGLQAGVYPDWVPTHFSNIARELSTLEDVNGLIQLRLKNKETTSHVKERSVAKELQKLKYQMEKIEQQQLARTRINKAVSTVAHTWTKDEEDQLAATMRSEQEGTIADALIEIEDQDSNGWVDQSLPIHSSHPASPSHHQRPDMDFFVNIFRDPPNVNELLASVRPPPTSRQAFKYAQLSSRPTLHDQLILSDLRMGDDSTREKAFLAVLYLKHRLSLGEKQQRIWCGDALFKRLDQIANEIRLAEPRLLVFTTLVLLEHHHRVVKHWRDLEDGLLAGVYPNWVPTHFSNIARELSILDGKKGLIQSRLRYMEADRLSRAKKRANIVYRMEQMEQPRQLDKARIDQAMITIAFAMARNGHGVPIMVPALDWDQGELFMTELEYEDEDMDEVRITTQPARDVTKIFTKVEDASRVNRPHVTVSSNEPSPAPVPCVMNRSQQTLHVFSTP